MSGPITIAAATLTAWCDAFLAAGEATLATRSITGEELESDRLKARLGAALIDTAATLVHELIEARDEKRLLRLQRQMAACKLLVIDELRYVPLAQTGAESLFEGVSQSYERGSAIVTGNLPFTN